MITTVIPTSSVHTPRYLSLLILLLLPFAAHAQTSPISATPHEIAQWLRSGDPRMVAWGAYFAAKTADVEELPVLASLAENYRALPPQEVDGKGRPIFRLPEQEQYFDSMQAVLDSLIQLHGTVAYDGVMAILSDFPAQALTLFATMPEPERSHHAAAVYATRDRSEEPYDWQHLAHQQMVHMAAAILSLKPPPGFTGTLLNETTVTLKISVRDDDDVREGAFPGSLCIHAREPTAHPGWPQPYTYIVEERWKDQNPAEGILIPGEPAITTRRDRDNSSCSIITGLTSVQRLRVAEEEAAFPPSAMGSGVLQYDTLHYPGAVNYPAAVAALIDRHKQSLRTLVSALVQKSHLTPAEAAATMPAFSVEILDERLDKMKSLPLLPSLGTRVSVGQYRLATGWFLEDGK